MTASSSMVRLTLIVVVAACGAHVALAQTAPASSHRALEPPQGRLPLVRDLEFAHLTTNDGLSQEHGSAILQDRRAFTWHATGDWLATLDDGLDTGTVYTTSRRRFW